MTEGDVDEVGRVERLCFANPWPLSAYRRELRNPAQNHYIVLRDDPHAVDEGSADSTPRDLRMSRRVHRFALWNLGRRPSSQRTPPIIGFAGMWNLFDEAHVTTIGVTPDYRRRGLGELLFIALIDEAVRRDVTWITLEVRVSNTDAQLLYRKYGFSIQGRRPRYYSDNNEDAFIMWSDSLKNPAYIEQIVKLRRQLAHKMSFEPAS